MEKCLKAIGKIIKCMEVAHLFGKMEENTQVNLKKIKDTARVHSNGKMVEPMMASG